MTGSLSGLVIASPGTGRVQAGEKDTWMRPSKGHQTGSRTGALYARGGGGDGWSPVSTATKLGVAEACQAISGAGYPLVGQDHGSTDPYGNSTAQTRVGQELTWLRSSTGGQASASKPVVAFGTSMGFAALINYFSGLGAVVGSPADVAAFVGVIPLLDLAYTYANNTLGLSNATADAWGVAHGAALPSHSNPLDNVSTLTSKPCRIYYGGSDPITPSSVLSAFAAAWGANFSMVNIGAGLDHSDATVQAVDRDDLVAWLRSVAAP